MSARRGRRAKRQNTNLAGFVVCLVFILAVAVFLDVNVFIVKRITVTGNKSVPDSDIIEMSGIRYGQRMLSVDLESAKQKFGHVGGMELVAANLNWPDGVELEIMQRNVRAVVEHLGTAILIDENANVIRVDRELPQDTVPVITGVDVSSFPIGERLIGSTAGQAQDISAILKALIGWGVLESVSEINLSEADDVYLVTRGGMIVTFGDLTSLDNKVMWMKNVLDELAAEGVNQGKLDVSSGKMAVYSK